MQELFRTEVALLRQTMVCLGEARTLANPQGFGAQDRGREAPGDVPLLPQPYPALNVGAGPSQAEQRVTKVTHTAGPGRGRKLGFGGDSCRGGNIQDGWERLVLPGNGSPCAGSKAIEQYQQDSGFVYPGLSTFPEVRAIVLIPHVLTTFHVVAWNYAFSFPLPPQCLQSSELERRDAGHCTGLSLEV